MLQEITITVALHECETVRLFRDKNVLGVEVSLIGTDAAKRSAIHAAMRAEVITPDEADRKLRALSQLVCVKYAWPVDDHIRCVFTPHDTVNTKVNELLTEARARLAGSKLPSEGG